MNPNEVNELLRSLIQEFALPVTTGSGRTLLITEGEEQTSKQCMETILKEWQGEYMFDAYKNENTIHGHWRVSYRTPLSEIHGKVERLAVDTSRVLEAKEVLQSLITERSLPFNIFYHRIKIAILPDNPTRYRTDDMIELETLVQEMKHNDSFEENDVGVYVRHSGFQLYPEEDATLDVEFSKIQGMAQRLQSEIEGHGLQVRLLGAGFILDKDQKIEIDISEAEELAYRLTIMTSINYRVLAYGMGPTKEVKPGWIHEVNWKNANLCTDNAYPY